MNRQEHRGRWQEVILGDSQALRILGNESGLAIGVVDEAKGGFAFPPALRHLVGHPPDVRSAAGITPSALEPPDSAAHRPAVTLAHDVILPGCNHRTLPFLN